MSGLVTVLTDFGSADGYVAAMKGAILQRAPELRIVDIAHEIAAGDLAAAAYVLLQAAPHFPPETVHLVVIDPGVGGERRALAGRIASQLYVAPDNGVLTHVFELAAGAHELSFYSIAGEPFAPADASPVFHGRDIFAPVAAYLAVGGSLQGLGPALESDTLVRLPLERARERDGLWTGSIIHVDRFGNLISNVPVPPGIASGSVELLGRELSLCQSYVEGGAGEPIALRGSSGWLEVAVNGDSAARVLGAARGDVIKFRVPPRS